MSSANTFLRTLIILSSAGLALSVKADYKAEFSKGKIPEGVTAINENGILPSQTHYENGYTANGWIVTRFNKLGNVALSPTHTGTNTPCSNRLTLPATAIEKGMWLRWNCRSVHPDFLESLRIEAQVNGEATPIVLADFAEVSATSHIEIISLDELAGKEATISFICNSTNKYMLLLGDIFIETPTQTLFDIDNKTQRFQACKADIGTGVISLSILNAGKANAYKALKCVDASYNETILELENDWQTGERRQIDINVTVQGDNQNQYTIYGVTEDGKEDKLTTTDIYTGYFVRNLLVDKGTGTWCTNCPEGIIELENLENKFPGNVIPCETHIAYGQTVDPMSNQEYWNSIEFYSAPYFKLNRIKATQGGNTKNFDQFYLRPTNFAINFTKVESINDDEYEFTATVQSASDIDNSSDRYRIGYVLTATIYNSEDRKYYQSNTPSLTGERFYYMPDRIPGDVMVYHNVTLTSENAFDGFEKSLPSAMTKDAYNDYTWRIQRPELLQNMKDGRLVAYVLDTQTKQIENATVVKLIEEYDMTAIEDVIAETSSKLEIKATANGELRLQSDETTPYTLEIFSTDGGIHMSKSGIINGVEIVKTNLSDGIYVARVTANSQTKTVKIAIQ